MRDAYPHEQAAFLAFGVMCCRSSFEGLRVLFSTEHEDKHESTDLLLTAPGKRNLRIDVTKGRRSVVSKILRSADFRRRNRKSVWPWVVRIGLDGPLTDVLTDSHFPDAWRRLGSEKPRRLSPQDIGSGELVEKLVALGRTMVLQLPADWQKLFD